ncbi:helix-turn-helix transcriptional regulator [Citrobacter portucalensis]|uniref:helix-turn-helix transcriptional regulator n=1 Tax=Citrobacter portucalensis TaxID=1639133 RepID=UPI0039F50A14
MTNIVKVLRLADVMKKIGVARSTIYDWMNKKSPRHDSTFPQRVRLGKASVGWIESELDTWLLSRKDAVLFLDNKGD